MVKRTDLGSSSQKQKQNESMDFVQTFGWIWNMKLIRKNKFIYKNKNLYMQE